MKRLSRKQKFWAVVGAGLLVAAISGSALAQAIEDRGVPGTEIQKEHPSTTFASPLPVPTAHPIPEPQNGIEFTGAVEVMAREIEPARESHNENSNVNANEHGNVNSNEDHGDPNEHHGNVNSNGGDGNDNPDGNGNSNGNDNHGGNVNLNHHNGNDEHGGGSD